MSRATLRFVIVFVSVGTAFAIGSAQAQDHPSKSPPPKTETAQPSTSGPTTMDNLQTAYNGESNAHARYIEFAKKAEAEGYGPIASLFRAAARAEEIHAENHAKVISKLGGTPKAEIRKIDVKSTKENLETAIEGENYERLTMYPSFIGKAKADRQPDAVRTFNYAQDAETEHAGLFKQARDNMETWKGASREFYVCSVCGYTTMKLDFERCLSCYSPKEKYDTVK